MNGIVSSFAAVGFNGKERKKECKCIHLPRMDHSRSLGILACKECSCEQRLPGVPGRRQRGWQRARNGVRNAVYKECRVQGMLCTCGTRGAGPSPASELCNSSCVSPHSSACPSPARIPPSCSNTCVCVLSPSTPRGQLIDWDSRQMAGVADNAVKINPKYLEMYHAALATWAVKAWPKCKKDRARHILGFQLLEHQQAPLCIKLKDAAYKLHRKRRSRKKKKPSCGN